VNGLSPPPRYALHKRMLRDVCLRHGAGSG
jgi:hypothetical protein